MMLSAVGHMAAASLMGGHGGRGSEADQYADADAPQYGGGSAQEAYEEPCGEQQSMFFQCLQMNRENIGDCQFMFDSLRNCAEQGYN